MALKTRYESEDEIPESLKEHAEKRGNAWIIDVDDSGDKVALQRSLEASRNDYKKLQEQYSSIDLEEYSKLKENEQQMRDKKMIEEGRHAEMMQQKLAEQAADYDKQLNALKENQARLERSLDKAEITDKVQMAVIANNIRKEAVPMVTAEIAKVFKRNKETNLPEARGDDNTLLLTKKAEPYTIETYTKDWATRNPWALADGKGAVDQSGKEATQTSPDLRVVNTSGRDKNQLILDNLDAIADGKVQLR